MLHQNATYCDGIDLRSRLVVQTRCCGLVSSASGGKVRGSEEHISLVRQSVGTTSQK